VTTDYLFTVYVSIYLNVWSKCIVELEHDFIDSEFVLCSLVNLEVIVPRLSKRKTGYLVVG